MAGLFLSVATHIGIQYGTKRFITKFNRNNAVKIRSSLVTMLYD